MTGKEIFNKPPVLTDKEIATITEEWRPFTTTPLPMIKEILEVQRNDTERNMIKQFTEWLEANSTDVTGKDSIEQILAIPRYKLRALQKAGEK